MKNEPPKKEVNNNKLLDFSVIFDEDEEQNWEEELNNYLDAPCAPEYTNILDWWRKHEDFYPILSKIARDKLSIMATSIPVERLFSDASLIDQPKRRSLKDDALTALLCISAWVKSDLVSEICGFDNDYLLQSV